MTRVWLSYYVAVDTSLAQPSTTMDYDSIKVRFPILSVSLPHLPQVLHAALPPFAPSVPVALLPYLAFLLLSLTFVLAFYFST